MFILFLFLCCRGNLRARHLRSDQISDVKAALQQGAAGLESSREVVDGRIELIWSALCHGRDKIGSEEGGEW